MTDKRLLLWDMLALIAFLTVLLVPDPALPEPSAEPAPPWIERSGETSLQLMNSPLPQTRIKAIQP
ncbi:MAG: hypothetical protein AAF438_19670 [Pseudomonadota bacterium]